MKGKGIVKHRVLCILITAFLCAFMCAAGTAPVRAASGNDTVTAQNTILTVTEAKALSSSELLYGRTLNSAAARVYNNVSGSVSGSVGTLATITQTIAAGDWSAIKAGTVGSYNVKYTAGNSSATVKTAVVPDGSVIGPDNDGDDAVYSKIVMMKSSDAVSAFGSSGSRSLMSSTYNDVHAVLNGVTIDDPEADTTDVTQSFADPNAWSSIKTGTAGSYSVTYACGTAKPLKVRIIIVKDSAHVTGLNDAVIAEGITVTGSAAKTLTESGLYGPDCNYVVGYCRDANGDDIDIVDNNESGITAIILQTLIDDWASIHAGTTGTYDVMYQISDQYDHSVSSITPTVTVMPDDATIVGNTGDAVKASSFIITSSTAKSSFAGKTSDILYGSSAAGTSAEYNRVIIDKSNKILTDSSSPTRKTASAQTITSSDWSSVQAGTAGQYNVTYAVKTPDDASKTDASQTVHVIVMPDGSSIDTDKLSAVYAGDVTINASQAKGLARTDLFGSSFSKVTAVKNGSLVSSSDLPAVLTQTIADADWSSIQAGTAGSYDVTYKLPGTGAAVTVKVTIVKDPSIYSVTWNVTAGSGSGSAAVEGSDFTGTISPSTGAKLPGSITVSVGGKAITDFTYKDGKVTIPAKEITGAVVITAVCPYEVAASGITGGKLTYDTQPVKGMDFTCTITPSTGAKLPGSITVSVGGKTITDFTYKDGKVTIPAREITGAVVITAVCPYEVAASGITGGKLSYNNTPEKGRDFSGRITADAGYSLPQYITAAVGGKILTEGQYMYDASTGAFTVKGQYVTGKVDITAKGIKTNVKGAAAAAGSLIYKVTGASSKLSASAAGRYGTVTVIMPLKKTYKSISIPESVTINKYTYRVTKIAAKAFSKCGRLKTIRFNGKHITKIGSKAFKTCAKKCTFKIPKSKFKKYRKMLIKSGVPKKAGFKKI